MAEADLYNMSDVFISYSRKDSEFVHRVFDDIKATGKEVWADFEDIPKAADWWEEIKAGIDAADAFVFVISPDSVQSDICSEEIDHAMESNKRLLPILYREIVEANDKEKLHPAISSHNWIFFRDQDDYGQSFNTLLESLETDLDHNRTLTRLLVRAKEWQDNDTANSYLLQGDDLGQADDWLSTAMDKSPAPTNLHAEYIKTSRAEETNRQRRLVTMAVAGMVVTLVVAAFALYQMYDAQRARDAANDARAQAEIAQEAAEDSERDSRAIALAARSYQTLANNNPDLSLVLAQEAVNVNSDVAGIMTSLADAAYAPGTVERISFDDVPMTAAYEPDGSHFASGFISGKICIYDGSDFQEISCLQAGDSTAHAGSVLWIHLNQDGTRLLSSGKDGRLVLWNIDHDSADFGVIIDELTIPELSASAMADDASFAVFGTADGFFGTVDLSNFEIRTVAYQHGAELNVVALNRDNSRVLAGTDNGVMLEYNLTDLSLMDNYVNSNNLSSISSVAYHPDSSIAIAGDMSAGLTSWDLNTGSIIRTYQGHDENVTAITFSDTGRSMFTSSWDNSIREWDVASGRIVQEFYGHNGGINALSITGDNLHMVSGGFDSSMRVWLVRPIIYEGQLLTSDESIYASDWNEQHIVAANEADEIFIYDRNSHELLYEVQDPNTISGSFFMELRGDGNNFAVIYADCVVSLFDMQGDILWSTALESDALCRQVGFRPNADEILAMSNTTLYRLNGRTGEVFGTVSYQTERNPNFRSFEFTADGTQLLVGENHRDQNLQLLDYESGAVIRDFGGHTDGVLTIDISRDGRQLASGSFDNDVRVWDFQTGESLLLLEGHSDRILDVAFNPVGNFLISASNDTTMRLWDLSTGITRYTYRGHTDRIVNAHFSPDGRRILTASHDSTLIIWRFPQNMEELEGWVMENRYLRELTCGERNLYLGESNDCG